MIKPGFGPVLPFHLPMAGVAILPSCVLDPVIWGGIRIANEHRRRSGGRGARIPHHAPGTRFAITHDLSQGGSSSGPDVRAGHLSGTGAVGAGLCRACRVRSHRRDLQCHCRNAGLFSVHLLPPYECRSGWCRCTSGGDGDSAVDRWRSRQGCRAPGGWEASAARADTAPRWRCA